MGTRLLIKIDTVTGTDHPHACGDKITGSGVMLSPIGSSPRVWGQADTVSDVSQTVGIIPTRVGTSNFF